MADVGGNAGVWNQASSIWSVVFHCFHIITLYSPTVNSAASNRQNAKAELLHPIFISLTLNAPYLLHKTVLKIGRRHSVFPRIPCINNFGC